MWEKGSGAAEGINWEKERFLGDGPDHTWMCVGPRSPHLSVHVLRRSSAVRFGMGWSSLLHLFYSLCFCSQVWNKASASFLFFCCFFWVGGFHICFYPYFKPNPFFMISHFSSIFKYIKMMLFFFLLIGNKQKNKNN